MNMMRRLKSIASGRSSVSDPGGDSSIKRVKLEQEIDQIVAAEEAKKEHSSSDPMEIVASTSDVLELPKEIHEMKIKDDRSDTHEDNSKDADPTVVSGTETETGQIIVTSVGGRDGQPKQTLSYMAERVVGTGSFGVVYQAKCLENGESVAIKKVLQDKRYKNRELQIMHLLKHPNVVQLKHNFYSTTEKNEVYLNLVLEYVSETVYRASRHYSKVNHCMPVFYVQLYTYQICRALNYIHRVIGVCHRDIKPQNLLVNPHTHQVKICDFGSAKKLVPGEPNISYICSRYYRAPELIFGATEYTTAIDMWSVGCVMAELLLGSPLFPGDSSVDQLVEIIKVLGTPTREEIKCMNPNYIEFKFPQIKAHPWHKVFHKRMPLEAIDLVSRLLQYSPSLRCTALEACAHPFFDELRDPNACLPNGSPLPPLFNFTPGEDVAGEYVRLEDEANDAYEVHGEDENNGGEGENEADLDAELDDVIGGNEPDPDCASATEADLERVCEPDTDDGDASEEADLCEDAYEDLEKENSNSDEDSAPTHFEWDETNNMAESDLNVGLRFPNRESFKTALKDWAVKRGYDLKFVKNERRKVTVLCKYGCEWRLHASPVMRGIEWMIKSHTGAHTCAHHTTNSQADYKYLGKRIMEYVRDNPTEELESLKKKIRRDVKVDVSTYKVYKAKKYAMELIRGDVKVQYTRLYDYCSTVVKYNIGSSCILHVNREENPPVLQRFYYCLRPLITGFKDGCRKMIGLDGCFLKGVYKGQLLSAVALDGNNNIYPLAWAFVEIEKGETWEWFLSLLLRDMGEQVAAEVAFISDRQKGLIEALSRLAPTSENRFCVRHMYNNFKAKYKGLELKKLFWKAASTYSLREHQKAMHDIRMGYPKVGEDKTPYEWLCDIPAHQWARSHFPLTSKSDLLVNNLSECFNSYILPARDLPIIEMMEWIRKKCMSRIQKKREWMLNFDKEVCPNILKKVEAERIISGNCFPTWGGGSEFEVIHGEQTHVVRLDVRNCTCGKWQRVGYPCCHAIAALDLHRLDYNPYIDHVFSKEVYMRVYENHISPVPGMHDFEISPLGAVAPPHIRTRAGRPKKRRRPDGNDQNQRQTSTRRGLTVTCAICLQGGHNRRRCRSQPHPNSKFFKASSENAQVSTSMPGPENASGSAPITGFENASVSPQMPGTDAIPTQSSASTSNVSKRKADKAPGTALKRLCKPTTSSLLRGVQFATKPKGKALGPPKSKGN